MTALAPASRPASPYAWLALLCLGRGGVALITMVYPACLPALLSAWHMNGAQAGAIQAAFNLSGGVSLLYSSWLADRLGARRILMLSSWLAAAASFAFGLFARSYLTGLVLGTLVGLSLGGTYTPAIMMVSEKVAPARRGLAVGWLLSSASFAYVTSLLISWVGLTTLDYRFAFIACGSGPVMGACVTMAALRDTPNRVHPRGVERFAWRRLLGDRRSLLLTVGYTAHTWELLGMWAWAPAFLVAILGGSRQGSAFGLGVAAILHLAGTTASFALGRASDRFGRRRVLATVAALGALCSFSFGWTGSLPLPLLLILTALYGFLAVGDSSVLSTAMTEAVPPAHLGSALALRSILGFGAGALAPVAFGAILDRMSPAGAALAGWGWAFVSLGVGGAVATAAAICLPPTASEPEPLCPREEAAEARRVIQKRRVVQKLGGVQAETTSTSPSPTLRKRWGWRLLK